MNRGTLPHLIMNYQKAKDDPQKTSGLLTGQEQVTRPKPLQPI